MAAMAEMSHRPSNCVDVEYYPKPHLRACTAAYHVVVAAAGDVNGGDGGAGSRPLSAATMAAASARGDDGASAAATASAAAAPAPAPTPAPHLIAVSAIVGIREYDNGDVYSGELEGEESHERHGRGVHRFSRGPPPQSPEPPPQRSSPPRGSPDRPPPPAAEPSAAKAKAEETAALDAEYAGEWREGVMHGSGR